MSGAYVKGVIENLTEAEITFGLCQLACRPWSMPNLQIGDKQLTNRQRLGIRHG
jgi:hypothetical protein